MKKISFGDHKIRFHFVIDDDRNINFYDDLPSDLTESQKWLLTHKSNPVEIHISGHPTIDHCGDRYIFTSESLTLKYIRHYYIKDDDSKTLVIVQKNKYLKVLSYYQLYYNTHVIRCYNEVINISKETLTLEYVSSFAKKDMIGYHHFDKATLSIPHNSWFLECQWKSYRLMDIGIVSINEIKNFKKFCLSNTGAWSSKNYLPMGMLFDPITHTNFLWQIEANGSWSYELGDFVGNVTLNLSGPTFQENGWSKRLKPKERFVSVKVAITKARNYEQCLANMTHYRRKIVRKANDHDHNPIIFNEYMLASWNCPSDMTAHQLAPTAIKLGAEYFVIDCGWHDEIKDPFYYVGKWEESHSKYPEGLKKTLGYIRQLGLKPGLWLEPEVVGALGDAQEIWDEDCFFHRFQKRLVISNRYQLDFRNKKVQSFFEAKIDQLVNEFHVEYFKLDYNIEPGMGMDSKDQSFGDALLEHNRAYHSFIERIGRKYPHIIIESCASGGNRLDYLTLDNVNIVSTSDQIKFDIYPYIIANILSAVIPEQAGIWCYPMLENAKEEDITYEDININILNSIIGRVHLASKLYLLSKEKQDFIKEGMLFYHQLDEFKKGAVPIFPLGFASYGDSHLCFGLRNGNKAYLWVYNMRGTKDISISLKKVKKVTVAFPKKLPTNYELKGHKLIVHPLKTMMARLFEVEYE